MMKLKDLSNNKSRMFFLLLSDLVFKNALTSKKEICRYQTLGAARHLVRNIHVKCKSYKGPGQWQY